MGSQFESRRRNGSPCLPKIFNFPVISRLPYLKDFLIFLPVCQGNISLSRFLQMQGRIPEAEEAASNAMRLQSRQPL